MSMNKWKRGKRDCLHLHKHSSGSLTKRVMNLVPYDKQGHSLDQEASRPSSQRRVEGFVFASLGNGCAGSSPYWLIIGIRCFGNNVLPKLLGFFIHTVRPDKLNVFFSLAKFWQDNVIKNTIFDGVITYDVFAD